MYFFASTFTELGYSLVATLMYSKIRHVPAYLGLMSKKKLDADKPPVTAVTPAVLDTALHVISL